MDQAVARKHRIRIKNIEETNLWLTPIEEKERILFKVLWVYTEANNMYEELMCCKEKGLAQGD